MERERCMKRERGGTRIISILSVGHLNYMRHFFTFCLQYWCVFLDCRSLLVDQVVIRELNFVRVSECWRNTNVLTTIVRTISTIHLPVYWDNTCLATVTLCTSLGPSAIPMTWPAMTKSARELHRFTFVASLCLIFFICIFLFSVYAFHCVFHIFHCLYMFSLVVYMCLNFSFSFFTFFMFCSPFFTFFHMFSLCFILFLFFVHICFPCVNMIS